jgi:hypothetical protein
MQLHMLLLLMQHLHEYQPCAATCRPVYAAESNHGSTVAVAVALAVTAAVAVAEQHMLTQDRVPRRHLHMTKPIGACCSSRRAAIDRKAGLSQASAAGDPRHVSFAHVRERTCKRASNMTAELLAAAAASTARALKTSCLTPQMYCSDLRDLTNTDFGN